MMTRTAAGLFAFDLVLISLGILALIALAR